MPKSEVTDSLLESAVLLSLKISIYHQCTVQSVWSNCFIIPINKILTHGYTI